MHFHEAFLTTQRKKWPGHVRFFNLPKMVKSEFFSIPMYADVKVEEYADYLDIEVTDGFAIRKRAVQLGQQCAGAWNCLTANVAKKGGTDLITGDATIVCVSEPCLKFSMVLNPIPSVADPMQNIPGWVSFRFKFAHYLLEG